MPHCLISNVEINRNLKTNFGKVSELYDKARIGYPEELIGDALKFSKIDKKARILDVGCGSGQLIESLFRKGFYIVGLDISQDLVEIAKKKYSESPNVELVVGSFEDFETPKENFDAIFSGIAWHWVKPERRYEKAYEILKKNGALALVWYFQESNKSNFLGEIGKILDKYGGKNAGPAGQRMKDYADFVHKELSENRFFNSVQRKEYSEELEFSKNRYVELVLTYGWVQSLSEKDRDNLIKDLQEVSGKYTEPLIIPYKYVLILARKKVENTGS